MSSISPVDSGSGYIIDDSKVKKAKKEKKIDIYPLTDITTTDESLIIDKSKKAKKVKLSPLEVAAISHEKKAKKVKIGKKF
jgi:hypothetical protein